MGKAKLLCLERGWAVDPLANDPSCDKRDEQHEQRRDGIHQVGGGSSCYVTNEPIALQGLNGCQDNRHNCADDQGRFLTPDVTQGVLLLYYDLDDLDG